MDEKYTCEWFDENKEIFKKAYYGGSDKPIIKELGIKITNMINEKYEKEAIVRDRLEKGIVDEFVVAWKAGRIDSDGKIIEKDKDNYLNGYGRPIKKKELEEYLEYVKNVWPSIKKEDDIACIYEEIVTEKVPHNFGCVYVINLIYFLSKGDWPIYDKFAHKAVKAIYMKKNPCEIWIGDAPAKYDTKKVINMYLEYCWLLERVFGSRKISRDIDRALWTYGHATK